MSQMLDQAGITVERRVELDSLLCNHFQDEWEKLPSHGCDQMRCLLHSMLDRGVSEEIALAWIYSGICIGELMQRY